MKEDIKFSSQMGALYFGEICGHPELNEVRGVLFSLFFGADGSEDGILWAAAVFIDGEKKSMVWMRRINTMSEINWICAAL